ncbi:thiol-disulfide isomerase/thioredoxin [Salsuginibacillus halophilus]|uniref:Thiol-disulfide isomerase/thioredoxin n=1 Tax=Salsuginibacillus halophilus TaxID=517424 RepID=A0A2P8HXH1_9BACI|nr:TlpA disulfide reductase family protein [Salsuginibacillus halophilus]PSL50922.1 thiol-disulfide isomerase/thioredoxin [Salsuginibacillus halophilus]
MPKFLYGVALCLIIAAAGVMYNIWEAPWKNAVETGVAPIENINLQSETVTLTKLDDTEVSSEIFSGKPVLMFFFTTWCARCQQELPQMLKYQKAQAENAHIVLVNASAQEPSLSKAKATLQEAGAKSVLLDKEGVALEQLQIEYVPYMLTFNADGDLTGRFPGGAERSNIEQKLFADD